MFATLSQFIPDFNPYIILKYIVLIQEYHITKDDSIKISMHLRTTWSLWRCAVRIAVQYLKQLQPARETFSTKWCLTAQIVEPSLLKMKLKSQSNRIYSAWGRQSDQLNHILQGILWNNIWKMVMGINFNAHKPLPKRKFRFML